MKVLVLLLLLGLQGCAESQTDQGHDKRLRIKKNESAYQLQLCSSTDSYSCITPLYLNFILCNDEPEKCDKCSKMLRTSAHDCGDLSLCEAHNSIIVESLSELVTSSPSALQPITTTVYTNEVSSTKVITQSMLITHTHCNSELANTPALEAVIALGSLIGLFLMILVLVVTGWVWTCWTTKKKKKGTQHCRNCQKQESDSEEERFCLNQIYKMTTARPVVGTAIEQPLDSQEESGQSVNGLSSKVNNGYCGVNRVENIYTSSEGSNHSSLQEQQRVNRVEERENGEKHVYYVLEKPEGDDYEESGVNLENTAMECEPQCHWMNSD